jgi:DNA invertase Pin-like site-specific DNA recombinase
LALPTQDCRLAVCLLALEEFRSLGIQFISYQENIDTTSPLGQALFTIVSAAHS